MTTCTITGSGAPVASALADFAANFEAEATPADVPRALSGDDLATKLLEIAERVVSRRRAEEIRAAVLAMEQLSSRQFAAVLRGGEETP